MIDFLQLFLDASIIQLMVDCTNKRAAQTKQRNEKDYYASSWVDVTVQEMRAFIGLRLSMEHLIIKPRYADYYYFLVVFFCYGNARISQCFHERPISGHLEFFFMFWMKRTLLSTKRIKFTKSVRLLNMFLKNFGSFTTQDKCFPLMDFQGFPYQERVLAIDNNYGHLCCFEC